MFKKVTPPHAKKLVGLFVLIAALCVISGGCGGGSHSVNTQDNAINALWNGGWLYKSGTVATEYGTQNINFDVQRFMLYFEDSDVDVDEDEEGSAVLSAVLFLSQDVQSDGNTVNIRVPLLKDQEKITVARDKEYEWSSSELGSSIVFDTDNKTLTLNGSLTTSYGSKINFTDVVLEKVDESNYQIGDVDALLNGTWLTTSLNLNGGYAVYNENPIFAGQGFMNAIFDDVSISNKSAHLTASATLASSTNLVLPAIISHDMTIEKIFGNIYKFDLESDIQPTKGIIVFNSTSSATMIIESVKEGMINAGLAFNLTKRAGEQTMDISKLDNTKWLATTEIEFAGATIDVPFGGIYFSADLVATTPVIPLMLSTAKECSATFSNVDADENTLGVSLAGEFTLGDQAIDVGESLKKLDNSDVHTFSVKHIGHNTLYAESPNSLARVIVINQSESSAYMFAEIMPTGSKEKIVISFAGPLKKQ